jgi:hypothetical protein
MPNIHELLDDTQKKCEALVKEMEAFKSARALNQKAAEGLDATCEALKATIKAIEPFTELRVRRMALILMAATGLNVILFVTTLLVVLLRK